MDDTICASCPTPSTQRTTITCGSCQRRWHALCVRVPAKKARELQAKGTVWHCRECGLSRIYYVMTAIYTHLKWI